MAMASNAAEKKKKRKRKSVIKYRQQSVSHSSHCCCHVLIYMLATPPTCCTRSGTAAAHHRLDTHGGVQLQLVPFPAHQQLRVEGVLLTQEGKSFLLFTKVGIKNLLTNKAEVHSARKHDETTKTGSSRRYNAASNT
jgi:hypothetical protein